MRTRIISIICVIGMIGVSFFYAYKGKEIESLLALILVELLIIEDRINGK